MAKKGGLGKGLDALFADNNTNTNSGAVMMKITEIEPNKRQPRKDFDEAALAQLADSIRQHGVIQPLLVRPRTDGSYQLVAGERRWRACRMAGVDEVPVVVREMSDSETMEIALIENLQREDLNPVEEALGYQDLMETFGLTQDEVSKRVGRSRPAIANALRLLSLPEEVLPMLRQGEISAGHARALLSLPSEQEMIAVAKSIPKKGYTVRDIEKMGKKAAQAAEERANEANASAGTTSPAGGIGGGRDSYYDEMALALTEQLGKKVTITLQNNGKGTLSIEFYDKEELSQMAKQLTGEK